MSRKSKEEKGFSQSELEDYLYDYYKELKKGIRKVKNYDSTFRCPFCDGKTRKDYRLKELLRHALDIGRASKSLREKAKHLALERYIDRYLDVKSRLEPAPKTERPKQQERDQVVSSPPEVRNRRKHSEPTSQSSSIPSPAAHLLTPKAEPTTTYKAGSAPSRHDDDQLFVWPCMGILANVKTELKNGRHVGESGSKIKTELTSKGLNPVRVHPLWNYCGHSGLAIVEFEKNWEGFRDAMCFEKSFEVDHFGKRDYNERRNRGDNLYGWVARDHDYSLKSIVGDHLRRNGDLKTVSCQQAEEQSKIRKLVSNLTSTLEMKSLHLEEMQTKCRKTNDALKKLEAEKEAILRECEEEREIRQKENRDRWEKVCLDHKKAKLKLEAAKEELLKREKQLQQRRAQNDSERRKIYHEREMNERAILQQKKADGNLLSLAEEQKRQKEELHKKIMELEKQLDAKQAIQLEIERMRGALNIMKHMHEDEDLEAKKKMDEIQMMLKEKEEEYTDVEDLYRTLVVKERRNNDEVQEARKELISGLGDTNSRAHIGVKRMGDLDPKPFSKATKEKYSEEQADVKALEFCSLWEDYLRDPSWHPFKIITNEQGKTQEIINDNDEKLKNVKNELGDEVYEAVTTALKEMNEYNPSGRYTIPELWNFKEWRKASLKEGVVAIINRWKLQKRKKR